MRDALAVHEAFRKLGFLSEEIFIHRAPEGLQVVLQAQDKEFVVDVWPRIISAAEYLALLADEKSFRKKWKAAVRTWNECTDEERWSIWQDAPILDRSAELVAKMVLKGFRIAAGGWN